MKEVHIVVGGLAIALSAAAGLYGAWCWYRARPSRWFWRILRAAQAMVVIEAALGGVLELLGHKAPSLHLLYGVLPLLVSFVAEQLRIASAQMVLDSRGLESASAVGKLAGDEQRAIVVAIIRRELGVMVLAALVIVVLLARAAGTA
ncbi:MAG: hypothetical protein JO372_01475 [Solirubrobacterales bacterium]|nr:hypothetical protein [Solirubrobacterales bacterium]